MRTATTSEQQQQQTGLSPYLLSVLYDFHGHSLQRHSSDQSADTGGGATASEATGVSPKKTKKRRHSLVFVVCHNAARVPRVRSDAELKALVQKRDAELRQLQGWARQSAQKDWQLVHEFLGWAQTRQQHFVYVYYTGGSAAEGNNDGATPCAATGQPRHWRPVSKELLGLFHSRLTNHDIAALWPTLSSSDVTESGDGRQNLGLDVRHLVARWLGAAQNEQALERLRAVQASEGDHTGNNTNDSASASYVADLCRYSEERLDERVELVCTLEADGAEVPYVESVSDLLSAL